MLYAYRTYIMYIYKMLSSLNLLLTYNMVWDYTFPFETFFTCRQYSFPLYIESFSGTDTTPDLIASMEGPWWFPPFLIIEFHPILWFYILLCNHPWYLHWRKLYIFYLRGVNCHKGSGRYCGALSVHEWNRKHILFRAIEDHIVQFLKTFHNVIWCKMFRIYYCCHARSHKCVFIC